MKKLIALLLTLCILFTCVPMAFAGNAQLTDYCDDPVIYIAGDSGRIYYDNDEKSFCIDNTGDLLNNGEGDKNEKIYEATASILLPFILEGIVFDKWDNYYAAVEKEIGELFEPIRLDNNGNVPAESDSGIGKEAKADREFKMTHDLANADGKYEERTYYYNYDWRLDPIELADDLHEYIEGVKRATGHSRVSITCKCLGTNVVLAYVNKYGTESLKGIGIDVATSNGADFLSGAISGDFTIDVNGLVRLANDIEALGNNFSVSPLIKATLELLANTGVTSTLTETARKLLYGRIEYGIISALATSTMMTFPCYWALIATEDFDDALVYTFGEEGSEKRQQYAGLIEKITFYNETIKKNVNKIVKSIKDPDANGNSTNICIISKYGTQMIPIIKDDSILGDYYVSVTRSSFGATTSTIYDTLSDEYIAERTAAGYGKYISPDKQIDASTCLFPDYTWFVKGCEHGRFPNDEKQLLLAVIDADRQLTVDDFDWTQYILYRHSSRSFETMTEENCHDSDNWKADQDLEKPQTKAERLISFLRSLLKWLKAVFEALTNKVNAKLGKG